MAWNKNEWFKSIFPIEVAEYIIQHISDENNPASEHAGDFTYYIEGNLDQKYYYDRDVENMCCGIHTNKINGIVNNNPVTYYVSWSYGH